MASSKNKTKVDDVDAPPDTGNSAATIYSNHPLYLHASNTTSVSLISIQLTGPENYNF